MADARDQDLSTGRMSAPDAVREKLRRAIVSGELAPGIQLKQDELAERFGFSRIPVREALRQLEAEGYVTIYPNRGAVVAELRLEDVLELLEIRLALESHALRLAVPRMVEMDIDAAEAILKAYDSESEPEKWGEMNWQFHSTLYAPCNVPKLLAMIQANYGHVSRFTRGMVSRAAGKEQPQREHYVLLTACRKGRVDRAVQLLAD